MAGDGIKTRRGDGIKTSKGDGVKTDRRARSQRNKIVTTLGSIATSAAALETVAVVAPVIVPPGVGAATAALAGFAATLVNIWWPK